MSIFDRFNKVFFLGAGVMAERIYKQNPSLKNKKIGAIDLFDDNRRKIKEFMGISVVNPETVKDELSRNDVAIVVAIGSVCACDVCQEYIKKYAKRTDNLIVPNPYTTLRFSFCDEDVSKETMLPKSAPEYVQVRKLFNDDESINTFDMIMKSKVYDGPEDDYELVMYDDIRDMYYYGEKYGFDEVVVNQDDWKTVLDCGAFIGDSIEDICKELRNGRILYYAFEPQVANYEAILKNEGLRKHCTDLRVINSGVGEKNEILEFMVPPSGARDGGHIVYAEADKNSAEIMKCKISAIDSLNLEVRGNLFIKMDIEGAELGALKGAEGLIRKCHPALSICVHHRKNDITQIPLFVKSLGVDYNYYLRGGYHTILLAIPKKK